MTKIIKASRRVVEAILRKRQLDERRVPSTLTTEPPSCVADETYDPFAEIVVGSSYGLYGEKVVRVEAFPAGSTVIPSWFDTELGHIAEHAPGGASAYIEVLIDDEKRAERHPFDNVISSNARRRSVQVALFES